MKEMASGALVILSGILASALAAGESGEGRPRPTPPVSLLRVPDHGLQPQAVVDAGGVLHLIYFTGPAGNGDISYVRSGDGGKTFSDPLRVNSQPGSAVALGNMYGSSFYDSVIMANFWIMCGLMERYGNFLAHAAHVVSASHERREHLPLGLRFPLAARALPGMGKPRDMQH